jgi:molybdenum cofactor synthesis domain-containing protein
VAIPAYITLGANVRRCGVDHAAGDVVVVKETRLAASHVAVLASIGLQRPLVVPSPRVGVLSTGDEVGPAPGGSGIRDVNRPGLIALLEASGATAVDLGVVGDDHAELTSRLDGAARECDAIITSGGVSVGDLDHTKRALAQAARSSGGVSRWMRVAVRPAKPLMFATIGATPVFGLPGNPASAFVSYHLFARPALDRLAGRSRAEPNGRFTAFAATNFVRNRDGRLHVVPVIARLTDGVMSILPAGSGQRHHLAATAGANAYAYLADGPTVTRGALVSCGWMSGRQAR